MRCLLTVLILTIAGAGFLGAAIPGLAGEHEVLVPDVKVGDWWERDFGGETRKKMVMKVEESKVYLKLDSGETEVRTREWNTISGFTSKGKSVTFEPHAGQFSFPLHPGKKWTTFHKVHMGRRSIDGTVWGKVVDWEEIAVPAGTFRALRLELKGKRGRRTVELTCWYAPKAKGVVKCDSSSSGRSFELVAYGGSER